ncbi:hypothetical protein BC941DRAFT_421157 [Chlamydoabsidia padenii]|nr:hypothetical protein BC941DRAFT_421157 [Chlamydoabsidia padenii]
MPEQSLIEQRKERFYNLCSEYIDEMVVILGYEQLEWAFPQEYTKGADLKAASEQMTTYARQHLQNSFDAIWEEGTIVKGLEQLETALNNDNDYDETNLLTLPNAGSRTGPITKLVPTPEQVVRAVMFKLKMKKLQELRELQEKLRKENRLKMIEVQQKQKELAEVMATPTPSINLPPFDYGSH